VTDTAAMRCPKPSKQDADEFRRWVGVPKPDVNSGGRPAYSVAALQKWIDRHESAEWRKNRAGRRLIDENRRCRGEAVPAGRNA